MAIFRIIPLTIGVANADFVEILTKRQGVIHAVVKIQKSSSYFIRFLYNYMSCGRSIFYKYDC